MTAPSKGSLYLIAGCMVAISIAYLLFLAASWNAYQEDRAKRDVKIDLLLERIPAKPAMGGSDAD